MPISQNGLLESGNSSIELTSFRKVLFEVCTIQDQLPTEILYKKKMMTRESRMTLVSHVICGKTCLHLTG